MKAIQAPGGTDQWMLLYSTRRNRVNRGGVTSAGITALTRHPQFVSEYGWPLPHFQHLGLVGLKNVFVVSFALDDPKAATQCPSLLCP